MIAAEGSAAVAPPPRWRGVLTALALMLATRLVVWSAAYLGGALATADPQTALLSAERLIHDARAADARDHAALQRELSDFAPLLRWDAGHYGSIIVNGYSYQHHEVGRFGDPAAQHNIAFFPLYPLLCGVFAPFIGTSAALVLVANVGALLCGAILYLLTRQMTEHDTALRAVALLACWPTACFLSFGYAESLTLALMLATILLVLQRRLVLAAIACGLATATRPTALWLAPAFLVASALLLWRQTESRRRWAPLAWRLALLGALAVSGLLAYSLYLTIRFGSPSVYAQNYYAGWVGTGPFASTLELWTGMPLWNRLKLLLRAPGDFPFGLLRLTDPIAWNVPLTLLAVAVSAFGVVKGPRWLRPWLLIGPLIFAQRYLASDGNSFALESLARYLLLAPAVYVYLAILLHKKPKLASLWLASSLLLQAVFALRFGLHAWCG